MAESGEGDMDDNMGGDNESGEGEESGEEEGEMSDDESDIEDDIHPDPK